MYHKIYESNTEYIQKYINVYHINPAALLIIVATYYYLV